MAQKNAETPDRKKPGTVDKKNQEVGEGLEETNAPKIPKRRGESGGMPGTSGGKGSRGTTDSGGFGGVG